MLVDLPTVGVVAVLAALSAVGIWILLARSLRRRRLLRRWRHARAAENRGAKLLERAGYRILGAQVSTRYCVLLDGQPTEIELCADYVVERRGATFVAEVKSGRVAPSVGHAPTRRQLLEYRIAFGVRGVLLVDAERERIHRVDFPEPAAEATRSGGALLAWVVFAATVAAAVAAFR